jgi:type IV pilus assembly protein PilE
MRHRGFTLLELLFVLVVVAVLAALVLPGFSRQMARVHRSEAMTALLQLQGEQEKFYLRHNTYARHITAAPPVGLGIQSSRFERYVLSIVVADDGQSYIATATPVPGTGQESDLECLAFSIDARGRRAVSGSRDARHCWR